MMKYGSWDEGWLGTGIAPLPDPPTRTTPGTPPTEPPSTRQRTTVHPEYNMVVGLKSVAQLTLDV